MPAVDVVFVGSGLAASGVGILSGGSRNLRSTTVMGWSQDDEPDAGGLEKGIAQK